jgi:N-formylglutamate amidohydrolase
MRRHCLPLRIQVAIAVIRQPERDATFLSPAAESAGEQRDVRNEQQTQDSHPQEIRRLALSVGAGVLLFRFQRQVVDLNC